VIEGGCRPAYGRVVASIALCGGLNVVWRFGQGVLADVGAAVAGRALAGQPRMAHRGRSKSRVILVASVTLRRSGNMDGRFAKGVGAVMAGRAATGGRRARGGVIEGGCRPAYGRVVAGIALCGGRNMGRGLGLRVLGEVAAAVAGRTLAGQPGVVHHRRRPGSIAASMAGVALRGRRDMRCRLG